MTSVQKKTYSALLEGASIVCAASSGYRIIDSTGSPIARIQSKTFKAMHPLLRSTKRRGIFLINKNEVRKLNGNSWVKKLYKKALNNMSKTSTNTPATAKQDVKYFMSYGRKNGMRQLQLLLPLLSGDIKQVAESAVNLFDMELRDKRFKGKGK
ncbi:MAG: hypothetical protein H7320_13775 [Ferruginibacter sp.]|nr:hypothetical protein [Ferruginibacter sp.]